MTPPPSLKAVVATVLELDPARLDDSAGLNVTPNWDSLNQFMIMAAVERELGAKLAFRDMGEVASLGAIRAFLHAQGIAVAD